MRKSLLILLVLFFMCSCTQNNYKNLSAYHNIDTEMLAKGTEENVVEADLQDISNSIVDILHENFSLDDTFVIKGDVSKGLYSVLVPTMKQSGFKVLLANTDAPTDFIPVRYTFTVTNNHLIEIPDVALLRLWVGDSFQLSKAFTWSANGLLDKTGYCVMGGAGNG